jgi:class 3 adenylate cyclase
MTPIRRVFEGMRTSVRLPIAGCEAARPDYHSISATREPPAADPVQPPMQPGERTLAVLFADVSGSTALYEALGDREAHRVVARCLDCLRSAAIEFGGRVVKFTGDGLLCVFDDADGAIGAASQMQTRMDGLRSADRAIPAIRVGVAAGSVLEDGDDVFGDTVNVASRIADVALPGQVLTTRTTVESLAPVIRAGCRSLHPMELKGVRGAVAITEVLWNTEATLTMVLDTRVGAAPAAPRALVLSHAGRDVRLDAARRVVRVGRDPGNDLVVSARAVSRWHARVALQQDNFVLVDESANGTFVRFDGKPEVHLQRDQTLLVGRGTIGLGESTTAGDTATVQFRASD